MNTQGPVHTKTHKQSRITPPPTQGRVPTLGVSELICSTNYRKMDFEPLALAESNAE